MSVGLWGFRDDNKIIHESQQPQKTCIDNLVYLCTYFDYNSNNWIVTFNKNEYYVHNRHDNYCYIWEIYKAYYIWKPQ